MFHASTSDVANYRVALTKSWMGHGEAAEEQAAHLDLGAMLADWQTGGGCVGMHSVLLQL